MLKFGNTKNEEEAAWEGDEDPFVTLDPDTRQEVMKNMRIEEIEEAGRIYKKESAKEKKRIDRQPKQLRKPPSLDQ